MCMVWVHIALQYMGVVKSLLLYPYPTYSTNSHVIVLTVDSLVGMLIEDALHITYILSYFKATVQSNKI